MLSVGFTDFAASNSDRVRTAHALELIVALGVGGKQSEQRYGISCTAVAGEESAVLSHLICLLNSLHSTFAK